MKSKKFISITLFFITTLSFSQQLNDGFAPVIDDFSIPRGSGAYNGYNPIGSIPDLNFMGGWQHLLVVRHPNPSNNYQLQIASSMGDNDKLFFRKLVAGSATSANSNWNELATRGTNNFAGNQNVIGNQYLSGDLTIGKDFEVATISSVTNGGAIQFKNNSTFGGSANRFLRIGWKDGNAIFTPVISINDDLNVGIGTVNPKNKLDVNGTIHSQEVKVDMDGWSDFVLKKDYVLPTLEEVEKHIAEKGHLENIPSEKEVLKNGINLGEMNAKLLQKIEEMTLYIIEQNKQIIDLNKRLEKVESK